MTPLLHTTDHLYAFKQKPGDFCHAAIRLTKENLSGHDFPLHVTHFLRQCRRTVPYQRDMCTQHTCFPPRFRYVDDDDNQLPRASHEPSSPLIFGASEGLIENEELKTTNIIHYIQSKLHVSPTKIAGIRVLLAPSTPRLGPQAAPASPSSDSEAAHFNLEAR